MSVIKARIAVIIRMFIIHQPAVALYVSTEDCLYFSLNADVFHGVSRRTMKQMVRVQTEIANPIFLFWMDTS